MPVSLTRQTEQAQPRHYEAADLDGDLRIDPVLAALSDAELETTAIDLHRSAEDAVLACCDVVVEFVRRAGRKRVHRAKAVTNYSQLTGRSLWSVYQMLAVGRYWTPERRALYPTLSYELLSETVRHTHRDGDTPRSREERIARVAKEAADADLTVGKARELARSVDRPEPAPTGSRSDFLELDEAPAPHPAMEPLLEVPPVVAGSLSVEEVVEALIEGLDKRLRRDLPGTVPLMVECVSAHLRLTLMQAPLEFRRAA